MLPFKTKRNRSVSPKESQYKERSSESPMPMRWSTPSRTFKKLNTEMSLIRQFSEDESVETASVNKRQSSILPSSQSVHSQNSSPHKGERKTGRRNVPIFPIKQSHSLDILENRPKAMAPPTIQAELEEKKNLQTNRRYIIRNTKKSQSQEDFSRSMNNFEEKLAKLKKENNDNLNKLKFYERELPRRRNHLPTVSMDSLCMPSDRQMKSQTSFSDREKVVSQFSSDNITQKQDRLTIQNAVTVESSCLRPTELSERDQSRILTQRLLSALHVKKNSELHQSITDFSERMSLRGKNPEIRGSITGGEEESTSNSRRANSRDKESQPKGFFDQLTIETITKLETMRSWRSDTVRLRDGPTTARGRILSSSKAFDRFRGVDYGPLTPDKALFAKKRTRVALDSFKKVRDAHRALRSHTESSTQENLSQTDMNSLLLSKIA